MAIQTQAAMEVARFLAKAPTPEQIIEFHPSPEVAERAYELIDAEREGKITPEEKEELDAYMSLEHIMRLVKSEAHHLLQQQAS
jgi:hypothetical protein